MLIEIIEKIDSLDKEFMSIGFEYKLIDKKDISNLYKEIIKIKRELFDIIPNDKEFETYIYAKTKAIEFEITVKIIMKEKLGLSTKNDYLKMYKLFS